MFFNFVIQMVHLRLKDKKEVSASIKTTRDRNTILVRLNNELNQELVEVSTQIFSEKYIYTKVF